MILNIFRCVTIVVMLETRKSSVNISGLPSVFHFMVYILGNLSLGKSKSLLLLPLLKGKCYFSTKVLWIQPIVEMSKIDGRKWRRLGRIKLNEHISFNIGGTDTNYIILISEANSLQIKTTPALLKYLL